MYAVESDERHTQEEGRSEVPLPVVVFQREEVADIIQYN